MSSDAPAVLVALGTQPIVTQKLGVKVVGFIRGVVNVVLGTLEEEEAVVVHELLAAVEVEEGCDVAAGGVVDELEQ